MRIALVQLYIDHQNKESNWTELNSIWHKRHSKRFFLGGPGRKSTLIKPALQLGQLAQKYQMDLVPGTVIEQDEQGHYYNVAYYIDKSGQVLLKYNKVHLWQHERKYLQQGDFDFGTVKNRFGIMIGLCACWDISVPEVFRDMALNGNAQLIIVPAYWTLTELDDPQQKYDAESEFKLVNHMCASRAFENGICVAFCDAAQRQYQNDSTASGSPFGILCGASQVAVPFKGVVAEAKGDHECLLVADIDVASLTANAEKEFQIRSEWQSGRIFSGHGPSTLNNGKFLPKL
ncbi:unnamed protein product [Absidia cylindrospora]